MTATDDASVLAGTDGGRPRCTRTGPDGVDLSQVSDTGAVPEIATGSSRNPFPPIADYAFLSDCESTCLISSAGVGGMAVRAPPGLAQRVRRTPGPRRPAISGSAPTGCRCRPPAAICRAA